MGKHKPIVHHYVLEVDVTYENFLNRQDTVLKVKQQKTEIAVL